ncbi:BTAD domain-containing putative transcriptional regulator [Streptomyces sp. NPDC097619]|uniref:AfsR/SARP family transcriptional regulator n=1 Tax=Streptomyces sp. NPDC097619 TaxID=3157228 RepID=UPI0033324BA6
MSYLLSAVWDEEPPGTARAALQTCVLRLRRIFAKYGIAADTIEAVPGGYRMRVDAAGSDLVAFRLLAEGAAAAGRDRGPGEELYRLREALSLWQGQPLANVASRLLQRDAVPALQQERLRVLERVCDLELAAGNCHQVLVDLYETATARRHPVRERFTEQLIEALYRTGRQAEALAELRTVRERLREELGVDPGPGLRRLELAILRAEELGGAPTALPAGRSGRSSGAGAPVLSLTSGTGATRSGVPAPAFPAGRQGSAARPIRTGTVTSDGAELPPPAGFTGRAAVRAALTAQLTDPAGPRLVVVSGAPGIGKSALALRCAHDVLAAFPGGAVLVPLTGPDGTPVGEAEARTLLPAPGDGGRLLLLDDATGAAQVLPLLAAVTGTDTRVVVTSRNALAAVVATHGGAVHRLDVLGEAEARALLSGLAGPDRIAAEPEAAGELARVCGHFPLALRIAAGRLLTRPGLSLADCAAWIAADPPGRLALPGGPRLSVPEVFGQALEALPEELREAFLRLADAPREPAPGRGVTEEELEQLVDAGLLEDGPPGPYRMHALLRRYARHLTGCVPGAAA